MSHTHSTTKVSMSLISTLGSVNRKTSLGAPAQPYSRQTPYKTGNPVRWLQGKIREQLIPGQACKSLQVFTHINIGWKAKTLKFAIRDAMAKAAQNYLAKPRGSKGHKLGRAIKWEPEQLAKELKVTYNPKEKVFQIMARYIDHVLSKLESDVFAEYVPDQKEFWHELNRYLPVHPNPETEYIIPKWVKQHTDWDEYY